MFFGTALIVLELNKETREMVSKRFVVVLLAVCFSFAVFSTAYGVEADTALLIQQSPVDGGTVTPGTGVHDLENGSMVRLSAHPRPGYQFVYWLGDVQDSTAVNTVTCADSPKIVIAVFERIEQEFSMHRDRLYNAPIERLFPGRAEGGGGGGVSPAGGSPESSPDPVPIPEPTTAILLLSGFGLLYKKIRS